MIEIYEQHGYKDASPLFSELREECRNRLDPQHPGYRRTVPRQGKEEMCFDIRYSPGEANFHFRTSYFVGVDWVDRDSSDLKICVLPKLDKQGVETHYIQMLLEALEEPENFHHLEELVHIDFHRPYIGITRQQDLLSPLLIAQFLQVLRRLVQKGLKKSYYPVCRNLRNKVKGKILVSPTLRDNGARGRHTHTVCQYQEFGVDSEENRILKKACRFSRRVIQSYRAGLDTAPLLQLIRYIQPAFEQVSDEVDIRKARNFRSNPLFREYDQALRLALLILRRYSYTLSRTTEQQVLTPPFWIDMSKLFELYVYKKLREVFPGKREVIYHRKFGRQEPDFLLCAEKDGQTYRFVIDAKYKPRYENGAVNIEDVRQVSGYARLEKVYDALKMKDHSRILDCLIIYSNPDCAPGLNFTVDDTGEDPGKIRKEKSYVHFYKLGIRLPERHPGTEKS